MLTRYTYFEKISATRTTSDQITTARDLTDPATAPALLTARPETASCRLIHTPTCHSTKMPSPATSENQATEPCPCGTMRMAARSGPSELPAFPPTWKRD